MFAHRMQPLKLHRPNIDLVRGHLGGRLTKRKAGKLARLEVTSNDADRLLVLFVALYGKKPLLLKEAYSLELDTG